MDPDAVWGGEWGRSRDGYIRLGRSAQREGAVLGVFHPIGLNGIFYQKCIRLVRGKLALFPYRQCIGLSLERSVHWLSEEIVTFEIEVEVYEKFAKM